MFTPQPPASRPVHPAGFLARMPAGGTAYLAPSAIPGDRVTTEDVGCVGTVVKIYNSTAPYLLADKAEVRWDDGATSHEPIRDLTVQASAPNPSPSTPDRETEIRQAIQADAYRKRVYPTGDSSWSRDLTVDEVLDAAAARVSVLQARIDNALAAAHEMRSQLVTGPELADVERIIATLTEETT